MQFCTRFRLLPGVGYRRRFCLVCLSCVGEVRRTISSWSHGTSQRVEKTSWEVQSRVKFLGTYSSIPADSAPYAVIHAAEVFFQTTTLLHTPPMVWCDHTDYHCTALSGHSATCHPSEQDYYKDGAPHANSEGIPGSCEA